MAQQLSLYLDLKDGELVDMDVAARIALAWSAAVRDIGAHVAPELDLQIKLESGTSGSLSLNGVLKSVGINLDDPVTLKVVVLASMIWVSQEAGSWTVGAVLDWLSGDDATPITVGMSDADKQDLAERVAKELQSKIGRENIQMVFREAKSDPSIEGIGSTAAKGRRPSIVVPRSAFEQRTRDDPVDVDQPETRKPKRRMKIVIVRPVLRNDTKRPWRFQAFTGEFSATIKDADFLSRALSGEEAIPLREGVMLDVMLQVTEHREGGAQGAWEQKSHEILKVFSYEVPPEQQSFSGLVSPEQKQTDYDD